MLSGLLSVISGSILFAIQGSDSGPSCIQPESFVVHRELGLVDLKLLEAPCTIERSSGMASVPVHRPDRWVRLRLDPDEQIRIRKSVDTVSGWFTPLAIADAAPEALETPAWAVGAVWYNIFPERFANGEPRNDQGWPHGTSIPWGHDWFEVSADEFEASANRAVSDPRRYRDDPERDRPILNDVVFERRFGGDLQGVVQRLDHIASLGATALWFCPVFEASSLHKYEATDHRHIDPHLGWPGLPARDRVPFNPEPQSWMWTPADHYFLDVLLPEVHARGLRLILDGVWNHVGTAHPAFRDALERGRASPYFEWFDLRVDQSGHVVGWRAWDRANGNLPAFRQIEGDLAPGPRAYVEGVTARWMDPDGDGDPSDGIDGWRLDVANEIGMSFWEPWRDQVRELNPEAVLFGELWFDGSDYFGGRAFDAQMNYPLAFVLVPWLSGIRNPDIATNLTGVFSHHPATDLAQMNVLGTHDTARLVSMLANPSLDYDQGAGQSATGYNRNRPDSHAYDRLELAFAVLSFLPGSPMVFAGDELGMWGGDDPENRKPLPWPDLCEDAQLAELANSTTERLGRWLRLRSHPEIGPILRYGGFTLSFQDEMLVIDRDLDGRVIRLYANPMDDQQPAEIGPVPGRSAHAIWFGEEDSWIDLDEASEKRGHP